MSRVDTAETARPHPGLIEWLAKNRVEFEVKEHPLTYTAMETARAEGIDPRRFAKVVGVEADGKAALLVVDALDQVDLDKAARAMAARHVRLLNEKELLDLAPGCAAGTIPPIGELFGLPVYVDHAIREDPEIAFHAGSHRHTVHVDRAAWEKAAKVVYCDLALERERPPAWLER